MVQTPAVALLVTLQVAIICEGYRQSVIFGFRACQKVRLLLHISVWAHQGQSHYDSSEREAHFRETSSCICLSSLLSRFFEEKKGPGETREDRGKGTRVNLFINDYSSKAASESLWFT